MDNIAKIGQQYIIAVVVATEVPPDAPEEEFKAVIDVMRNRARLGGKSLVEVVLEKNQFSAVCREQYWRDAMAGKWLPGHVARCGEYLLQEWEDTTGGATHYYSPISMIPKWSRPSWSERMRECMVPGTRAEYFKFYKEI